MSVRNIIEKIKIWKINNRLEISRFIILLINLFVKLILWSPVGIAIYFIIK